MSQKTSLQWFKTFRYVYQPLYIMCKMNSTNGSDFSADCSALGHITSPIMTYFLVKSDVKYHDVQSESGGFFYYWKSTMGTSPKSVVFVIYL